MPLPPLRSMSLLMAASLLVSFVATGCGDSSSDGAATCGNGTVEAGETCDDGNKANGDGCSATCKTEAAGICGDGTVNTGETCDDGNTTAGDGCSATCQSETAGVCGDGAINSGETCDDGNTTGGDGCSATCQTEGGPMCGNAIKDVGEECDDGNPIPLDGCESDCTVSPEQITCATLPASANVCDVTAGDANKLILGDILGPYTIYRGGQVLLDATGNITCVGCDCATAAPGATKISCPKAVVSPGLINTHEHITFAQNNPYTDTGERYEQRHDWRKGLNGHTKLSSSGGASADQIRWGELRFLLSGATSLVGSGSATGFLRNLDKADQEGLSLMPADFDTFPLGDSGGQQLAMGCGYPNINTQMSIAADTAYLPHISEGIDAFAHNEFLCVAQDQMTHDLVEPQSAFIHSVGLFPADYASMATVGTSLIWSPRSNTTLYGDTAVVTVAARVGVNIALGTDWIVSGSMNMHRELTCASELNATYFDHFFTDRQLWQMTTLNAAKSLHADSVIGALRKGLIGDVAIYDASTHADYRAIIDGEPKDVALVLRGGKPIYGEDSVISALSTGACDAVDVCGNPKKLCAMDDIGKTYAQLKTAAGATNYPAFFCGKPTKEPSCIPTRPVPKNGSTVYTGIPSASDSDGDGIPNASDDCPTVFNPVRPMDNGSQGDFDQDGVGDACDVCPLNANTTVCTTLTPGDSDGDGIPNAGDNCPTTPNPGQKDADQDMKGDACDTCPMAANPGNAPCLTSIYDIKQGLITGSVALNHVIVTGCKAGKGYFVQVKQGDVGYVGSDYSGIWVFDATADCVAVKPGDRVDFSSATIANFFGEIELTTPTAVVTSSGEALPVPVDVTPQNAAGTTPTALEGVLVKVSTVTVTDIAPPAGAGDTAPTNEFEVASVLRVNDVLFLTNPFPAVGSAYTSITGILDYRNGNQKLEPRSAADFVTGPAMLSGFSAPLAFTRVGYMNLASFPTPITVQLTSPATSNTFIAITGVAGVVDVVGGGVTIPSGQSSATVFFDGLAQSPGATITASYLGVMKSTQVRVLGAAEQPTMLTLSPATVTLPPLGSSMFAAKTDIPAPPGGLVVSLGLVPANAGTVPVTVTIPADETTATFNFSDAGTAAASTINGTAGALMGQAAVTILAGGTGVVINEVDYDTVGTDAGEFVELFNSSTNAVSLTNLTLVFINGSNNAEYSRTDLATLGSIGPGQYLVVGSTSVLASVMPPALKIHFDGAGDTGRIQNGAPDAIGLVDLSTGTLLDALSYEGSVSAGIINGITGSKSFVENAPTTASDNNTTIGSVSRLPNGIDTNDAANDWGFTATPTPGTINQ